MTALTEQDLFLYLSSFMDKYFSGNAFKFLACFNLWTFWNEFWISLALSPEVNHTCSCWTSNVLHVQNWRKAIYKKYWNLLIRNYSAGLFSGTSLTKKQPRNTFLQSLYSMHRRVSASHWLGIRPGLLQSAPTFFVLLPRCSVSFSAKITHDRALDSALF